MYTFKGMYNFEGRKSNSKRKCRWFYELGGKTCSITGLFFHGLPGRKSFGNMTSQVESFHHREKTDVLSQHLGSYINSTTNKTKNTQTHTQANNNPGKTKLETEDWLTSLRFLKDRSLSQPPSILFPNKKSLSCFQKQKGQEAFSDWLTWTESRCLSNPWEIRATEQFLQTDHLS